MPGPRRSVRPDVVGRPAGGVPVRRLDRARARSLAKDPLWKVVQAHPSAAVFPGRGESLRGDAARAVDAVRDWDARVAAAHGADALWVAVSHGDVIKAIVADAVGLHLDAFQRIVIDPCSVTVGALHRDAAVRAALQRHRGRPGLPASAAEATPSGRTAAAATPRSSAVRTRRDHAGCARAGVGSDAMVEPGVRVRPARPVRRRHRGPARASARSSCRRERQTASTSPWRWRSSRSRCSPSGSRSCSTRWSAAAAARRRCPRSRRSSSSDTTPLDMPVERGVPGRHDEPGLGRRRRARRHRGLEVGDEPVRSTRTVDLTTPRTAPDLLRVRDHRRERPRVRQAGRRRGLGRAAAVPLLRPAAGPGGHVCPRANGYRRAEPAPVRRPPRPTRWTCCGTASLEVEGRMVDASNATLYATVSAGRRDGALRLQAGARANGRCGTSLTAPWPVVRSPPTRSRPRPGGTSCPPTVLRDGPFGPGSVQLWVDEVDEPATSSTSCRAAVPPGWRPSLDGAGRCRGPGACWSTPTTRGCSAWPSWTWSSNNADRKGGHVLLAARTAGCTASTTGCASTSRTSCARSCGGGRGGPARRGPRRCSSGSSRPRQRSRTRWPGGCAGT